MGLYDSIKKTFGKPNRGIHKYSFLGIPAIWDWVFTILGALIMAGISYGSDKAIKEKHNQEPFEFWKLFLIWFFGLFVMGVVLHKYFKVGTRLDKLMSSL